MSIKRTSNIDKRVHFFAKNLCRNWPIFNEFLKNIRFCKNAASKDDNIVILYLYLTTLGNKWTKRIKMQI